MKRISAPLALVICCTFIMFCTGSARAQQLLQRDKDKALQLLESTRKDVLDATKGLSDAQWNFKIAPDRSSVAECMEHIAAAEDYIRGMIIEKGMVAPAAPTATALRSMLASLPTFQTVATRSKLPKH